MNEQVVTYDTGKTYLEGWYTLKDLQEVINTMEMLNDAAQQRMRQNLSDIDPKR